MLMLYQFFQFFSILNILPLYHLYLLPFVPSMSCIFLPFSSRLIALTLQHCINATYRRHRLPLALHLAFSLNPVPEVERNLLFDGASLRNDENSEYTLPDWIPEERKLSVKALASTLPLVASKLKPAWVNDTKNIYDDQNLTSFQKTLVVQALRPDHLHTALTKLATEFLGMFSPTVNF